MNRENFERHVKISSRPLDKREIASNENLSLAALDNQLRAERDDADPITMTARKLEPKIAGMMAGPLQLEDSTYARFREEDEELLREAQRKFHE